MFTDFGDNFTSVVEYFKKLYPTEEWEELGQFTEDYIYSINKHWLQFSPPNASNFYSLAILYIFIMSVGIFGNFMVILLYCRAKSLRTPANLLTVNLAISDCTMMCEMPIFIFNSFYKGPVLGDIACRLYGFLGGLTGTVSICTLTSISLDRYFVIKFPLQREYIDLRVRICLIISWIYGLTFSVIPAIDFGLGKYTPEGYLTSCSFDYLTENKTHKWFIMVYFVAAWVIPFSIIAFSYANIVQVVVARSVSNKAGKESFRHVKEEDKRKQEVKLAVIVLFVIFLWFAAWTPYAIVALLGIFDKKEWITPTSSMIPALFCKTASAVDPYVYALTHPKFKAELKSLICGKIMSSNTSRVWTTETTKVQKKSFEVSKEVSDVEEEVVELSLGDIPMYEKVVQGGSVECETNLRENAKKLRRQVSKSKMFCFQPSFSNKTSSLRKIARTWSTIERKRHQED